MKTGKQVKKSGIGPLPLSMGERSSHGRIISAPDRDKFLDPVQLHQMERSFRQWSEAASRADVRAARRRILLIFLLIRYTGAKLNEVLRLDPGRDIDFANHFIIFGRRLDDPGRAPRKVQISESFSRELRELMNDPDQRRKKLSVDPGFIRRKFYERAAACGIPKHLGAPEVLRRSRGVELMQNNMPLPAVQILLGHSTPNLTTSHLSFSEEDIQHVTRLFMEKESARRTSARNSFYGKIHTMQNGDIQTRVKLVTMGGQQITTIITNDSMKKLNLKRGQLITAEVKAPWVIVQKGGDDRRSSADNMFKGVVDTITRGELNTEYIVRIADGTEVCSIVTTESSRRLDLAEGDEAWVLFNSYSVVLLSE